MTGTTKLSVEKALDKIREGDMQKSETTRMDEEIAELDKSIKRMRAQRLRLESLQRRSTEMLRTHLPGSANRQPRGQASSLGYSVAKAERRVQREHLSARNNHFRVVTPTCLPHCGG